MRFNNKNVILPEPIADQRFRLVSLLDGSVVRLSAKANAYSILQYSLDGRTWNNLTTSSVITLNNNNTMFIRGKLTANAGWSVNYNRFNITGQVAIKGNIMYFYNYEHPENTTLAYEWPFCGLFSDCSGIVDASELILPATTLSNGCYNSMFTNCTNLQKSPVELPATTLTYKCYLYMFLNCTNLINAPELPATVLAESCYEGMFDGCINLINVPSELPTTNINATIVYATMFGHCSKLVEAPIIKATNTDYATFTNMFNGCSSLKKVVIYTQDISGSRATENWLKGVSVTGDFYNLGGANYPSGASGIPSGWTIHTSL